MKNVISKKNLLYLVEQNLKEMAMDFETPDRPDQGVMNKLASGETSFKKVPLPKTGQEPNKNFQEVLASERYKQVVQTLRRYLGPTAPTLSGQNSVFQLQGLLISTHRHILNVERDHKDELVQLAIEIVMEEMGLVEGDVDFDADIVSQNDISPEGFNMNNPNDRNAPSGDELNLDDEEDEDDVNFDDEETAEEEVALFNEIEALNLENAKRRMINAIIQGASKRGHYMFHNVSERLRQITGDPTLIEKYGILMSINDLAYWQMTDELINSGLQQAIAGKTKVKKSDNQDDENGFGDEGEEQRPKEGVKQTIYARGINFPVLVHELIKGTMELLSKHGKSTMHDQVKSQEDLFKKEIWDIRLGPAIWDRLRSQMPEDILVDETKKDLQSVLLVSIFQLPAKQFLVFMKEVLSKSQTGRRLMNDLMSAINNAINDEEYQEAIDRMNSTIDDISDTYSGAEMNDLLSNLGISTTMDFDNLDLDDEDDDDVNLR